MPPSDRDVFDAGAFLATVTRRPGVYRMLDADERTLYIGKAKNLRARLGSYFRSPAGLSPKVRAMVSRIADIQVTVTATEAEALLLEQNLIKAERPPYNVLLRDDKSYPYIFLSDDDPFPRMALHRGARRGKGRYFGPYPSAGAARDALNLLQKVFQVRQCENSFFRNRSRPCLQHQIGRCTAPCVDLVSPEAYAEQVRQSVLFLEGRNDTLLAELSRHMEDAARAQHYEKAAQYRDRIAWLRELQTHQRIEQGQQDLDVVALTEQSGQFAVQVLFVRQGRVLGSRSYFPDSGLNDNPSAVMAGFLSQFYLGNTAQRAYPSALAVNTLPDGAEVLAEAVSTLAGRRVRLFRPSRGPVRQWLDMAERAIAQNLSLRLATRVDHESRLAALADLIGHDERIERLEGFDVSHHRGDETVASCVVFDTQGPRPRDYRRFSIREADAGDDYAAMREVLRRRYTRLKKEAAALPDLVLIDGGKGQLSVGQAIMEELQLDDIPLLAISKGPQRRAGEESYRLARGKTVQVVDPPLPVRQLLQHVRDEAHRFAIGAQRRRQRQRQQGSDLLDIPGVGPKRKKALLLHFGGRQGVAAASVSDLCRVSGINRALAEAIYDSLHKD